MLDYYKKIIKDLDYTLLVVLAGIILFGLMVLNSATMNLKTNYVLKQSVWVFIALAATLVVLRIDYNEIQKYTKHLYIGIVLALILVLLIAPETKGARSWIEVPGIGKIQPSEFAKIAYILMFAKFLSERRDELDTLRGIFNCFLYTAPILLLILKQPDLGTSLVIISIMVGMMFVAGGNKKILISIFGGGTIFTIGYLYGFLKFGWWIPLKQYQLNRILVVLDNSIDPRGAGWNLWQSKIAIGNGGILGKGLKEGTQSGGQFLPEQWTDFIFSVLGEELGFLGGSLMILLFFILIYRGMKIASLSKNMYGSLIAVGVTTMYLFHIFENIGMCVGIMPITGIPLPFVSYGGSSMLTNMMGIGLLQSVYVNKEKSLF